MTDSRTSTRPEIYPERRRARAVARTVSLVAGTAALVLGTVLAVVTGSLPLSVQYVPLLVSVVVLGLPHGAVDHLVLPRARNEPITTRSLAAVGALYLVVGAAYAAVWLVTPVAAFVLFILATLFHWGQGDVYVLVDLFGADYLDASWRRLLTLVVRGGAPMLVPLVAFPEQYGFVAGTLVGLFDPDAAATFESVGQPRVRLAVGLGYGLTVVTALGIGYVRSGNSRAWRIDAGETVALVAFFAAVPPVLAIGCYFCFWHSVRHIFRTMLVDDGAVSALAAGALGRASRRFARDATPLTVGAILVLGAVALLLPQTPATVPEVGALYLVTIAILTLPHIAVVSVLDRIQGLWWP
ncbi:Brp/Blh family beta-carotene 15,15'-dioxygenase [Natronorubrum sp. DTA7]|uniref:Brp/Blh family beta-carotene 15,15'-dioxygenase n=1 Tax=Natronorubrum sp. DTA7 TaxID=3447016 RepID=UPI003F872E1C